MPKELAASGGMEAAREAAAPLLRRAAGPEAADRLLEGLARLTPGEIREPEAGPLAKLRARLEAWPELPWKLEDMAEAAFMSKYHLIRSFRRETGLTPHQFQLQNRVRKGQRLLAGPATVAEAAAAAAALEDYKQVILLEQGRRDIEDAQDLGALKDVLKQKKAYGG